MKYYFLSILNIFFFLASYSQQPVIVSEGSIKIAGLSEEKLYFGFATNDKIVFTFSELQGKTLKEVEILEYPSTSRYTDFKAKSTHEKTITVTKEGVYCFRFYNGKLGKRICKYSIQRIPASAQNQNFNTTVTWITKSDTTWNTYTKDVIIGYDTTYIKNTKKVAVSTEKVEEVLFDKIERVHSRANENGNKTWISFSLPQNIKKEFETKTVIAWAYWVGVGKEANEAWEKNVNAVSNVASGFVKTAYGPLGALSIGAIAKLLIPTTGEDVFYTLTDQKNKDHFMAGNSYYLYDKGKGIAGYKKFNSASMCKGTYYICLSNDNYIQGINVNVKVSAIIETVTYEDQPDDIPIVIPKTEKQIFSEPKINTYRQPEIMK
jgi:hypothetical protein